MLGAKGSASWETMVNYTTKDGDFKRLSFSTGPGASASAGTDATGRVVLKNFDDKMDFTVLTDKDLQAAGAAFDKIARTFSLVNTPNEDPPASDEVWTPKFK